MGIVESVRGVLWAPRRQPEEVAYQHVRKIKAMEQLGATAVVVMNVSGSAPDGTLRMYGEHVLPQLRDEAES
jgi:hypothetical protein